MSNSVQSFARKAAERVDERSTSKSITAIIGLITTLLPAILQLFQGCGGASGQSPQAQAREANQRNPGQLRRRTRHAVRQDARSRGEKLSGQEVKALADAMIEEAIDGDSQQIAEAVAEVQAAMAGGAA